MAMRMREEPGRAVTANGSPQTAKVDQMERPRIGLGGYCPVCILDVNKWVKGSPECQAIYDGVTYYFPDEDIKAKFVANPAKYVPALDGDCVVCYAKLGKRVPGSVNHTARYDSRLFLFPGAEQQQAFLSNPKEFANVDLALNGDCAVCQVHHNKRVAGKPEFTEIKDGLRYRFVSDREQAAFRKDPAHYVDPASKSKAMESPMSQRANVDGPLTVTGRTACAGCDYGVVPIQNPDELGLAVNTDDGRVVIIEQAHKLYRDAYVNRYSGQRVPRERPRHQAAGPLHVDRADRADGPEVSPTQTRRADRPLRRSLVRGATQTDRPGSVQVRPRHGEICSVGPLYERDLPGEIRLIKISMILTTQNTGCRAMKSPRRLLLVLAPAIALPLIARATIRLRDCSRDQGETYHVASIRTGWDPASRDRR